MWSLFRKKTDFDRFGPPLHLIVRQSFVNPSVRTMVGHYDQAGARLELGDASWRRNQLSCQVYLAVPYLHTSGPPGVYLAVGHCSTYNTPSLIRLSWTKYKWNTWLQLSSPHNSFNHSHPYHSTHYKTSFSNHVIMLELNMNALSILNNSIREIKERLRPKYPE